MTRRPAREKVVQILDRAPPSNYNALPSELFDFLQGNTFSAADRQELCLEIMEHYLRTASKRLTHKQLPESVGVLCAKELRRIKSAMEVEADGYFSFTNDLFLKDLGLARLNLIPVGAELVDEHGGIPRSLLLKKGVRQFVWGACYFLFKTKGFKPFYQLHLDPRKHEEFTPQGWHKTYFRLAELLSLNPQMKGFFGASWFYDPRLDNVSSHLSYLRKVRLEGGAQLFRWESGASVVDMATSTSRTRKKMFEEGDYLPCSYMIVWSRDDLLRWAARHRREIQP